MFAFGEREISTQANQDHRDCFFGSSNSQPYSLGDSGWRGLLWTVTGSVQEEAPPVLIDAMKMTVWRRVLGHQRFLTYAAPLKIRLPRSSRGCVVEGHRWKKGLMQENSATYAPVLLRLAAAANRNMAGPSLSQDDYGPPLVEYERGRWTGSRDSRQVDDTGGIANSESRCMGQAER